ncbi:MAG: hypothetical protein PVH61_20535 [Candidatus Aminicenantes bacterium]|jgi:hypothetical protein
MKNETEKEIEHVNTAEDFLNKEIRQDSKLHADNNKTQTFQSPGPMERNKKQRDKYRW